MQVLKSSNGTIITSSKNVTNLEVRKAVVTYHPSAWGDHFLVYASNSTTESCILDQHEVLQHQKEEVKKLLGTLMPDDSNEKLDLIDAIERLGLGYQFQPEISKTLGNIYNNNKLSENSVIKEHVGLRSYALRFRLLRQHGYNIPCDGFNRFKNIDGKFKESLINDVEGLLSLYEAANFRVHGEDILEEAFEFCQTHLNESILQIAMTTNASLAERVDEALKLPIHKTLTLLGVKKFMSWYQQDETRNQMLLNLAKAEFNKLQKMHQKELAEITRWWKELDFTNKLPFARDRVVECYFWSLAIYFEPQHSLGRRILSKVAAMTSTIDDIYDVYGTLDELQLFTDAVQRWDASPTDELPPYMKVCYQALVDAYVEAEHELEKIGRSYCVQYAKEEMKKLVRAFFEEAKWMYKKQIPSMKEYMKVAVASSSYMMAITTSLLGLGDPIVSREHFDWASNEPLAIQATSIIARLMNDVAGYGFEQDVSAVQCYMNNHIVSEEDTFVELGRQVTRAWKDINQACLIHLTTEHEVVPMPIMMLVRNASKIIYLLYRNKDGYTNSNTEMKDLIRSVLVESIQV